MAKKTFKGSQRKKKTLRKSLKNLAQPEDEKRKHLAQKNCPIQKF